MKFRLKPEEEIQILRRITETISCTLNLEEVLKRSVEIVIQITEGDACLLYLFDDRKEELILRASKNPHPKILGKIRLKLGEGITGWVAKEKKSVAISKNASDDPRFKFFHNLPEDKYQAFLSVPIISKNEVIGVINVQHKQAHQHSRDEIALLSTIAQQVGGAIENARLYEETKKRAMQLETLAQVSKTIASNRYLKEILQLIVTMTAEMMNSKICSIMFLNEKKQELTIEATQSLSEEYIKKPPLRVGESISGKAVKEKKPITVLDVTEEPGYKYPQIARKEGICSMLAVPMMVKNKVVGVINSYTANEHKFTEDEINILQSVANQAAVAIENTKLMEEILAAREALEVRKLVERAKGILMKETGMGEDEAYRTIHRKSMDMRRSMREIAEAIILTSEMKK
ncbi:MAG: GAF domain-containing protein [bacterium]